MSCKLQYKSENDTMEDISESTAHMESDSGEKHCIAFSEVKTDEDDTQWIRIPDLFATLDYLGIQEDDVEMYHNEDGFVSFGSSTGQGIAEIPVEEHDGEYWLKVTEEMERSNLSTIRTSSL